VKFKRVLVPLDGSPVGEAVLARAVELGRDGATLMLLRAAEARTLGRDMVTAQVDVVKEAEVYLADVSERLRRTGVTDVETSVWYGPAPESIVEAARCGTPISS
jgi:nucleotide-binding universal stress UspA family protein